MNNHQLKVENYDVVDLPPQQFDAIPVQEIHEGGLITKWVGNLDDPENRKLIIFVKTGIH